MYIAFLYSVLELYKINILNQSPHWIFGRVVATEFLAYEDYIYLF